MYNFSARPDGKAADTRAAFDAVGFPRLRSVKTAWDPVNLFRFNVNIPPTS